MLYLAYLDEFGHIGPYISHDDPRHNTHPIFGLGGIVLPYPVIRKFSMFFFMLKNNLLEWEVNRSGQHPAKWEKKGSALYTALNVKKYRQLRIATNRYFNQINKLGGYVFYVGKEKKSNSFDSKLLYQSVLKEAIKRLDQECENQNDQFLLILDQQDEVGFRAEIVETASIEMFREQRFNLLEPPIQAESHLYQTLQCADWICGIISRLSYYQFEPENKPQFEVIDKYFKTRLNVISKRSSIRSLD